MRWLRSARRVPRFFRPLLVELEARVVPAFIAPPAFDTGSNPHSVAVGDLTGDGISDLIVANDAYPNGTVSVLLGNGDGSFQPARTFAAGSECRSVAVGDFNGDGRLDIVVANYGSNTVGVLLGNGDGSFQPQRTYAAGPESMSVAVGDFNGDGHLDLAVANWVSNGTVSILLGNGDGSFGSARTFAAGTYPEFVAVGDFNGDGVPDLAVADEGGSNGMGAGVTVLLGRGNGGFQPTGTFAAGVGPDAVAVADFNHDGNADLAVANGLDFGGRGVSVLLGDGHGFFQAPRNIYTGDFASSVAVGDFNGDGRPDIVVANPDVGTVGVLLGNGDGSFQNPVSYFVGSYPSCVVVNDFNHDGHADLAVAAGAHVSVLLGNGDGAFPMTPYVSTGARPESVAAADFNGDGRVDLVATNPAYGNVAVLLGNGNGTFQAARTYAAGVVPYAVVVGDVNGDGVPDLVVTNVPYGQTGAVSVLLGNGDGSFRAPQTFAVGDNPYSLTLGDFNADGRLDLAVANAGTYPAFTDSSVSVLLGNGDGSFQAAHTFAAGIQPYSVVVGDFTGDGRLDLAVANTGTFPSFADGSVSVLLGNGDGSFQAARNATAGTAPVAVVGADLNGDGVLDLAVVNLHSEDVSILLGNGDGSFHAAASLAAGSYPRALAVGDINGDGHPDVVVTSDTMRVLLGNGNGTFQPTSVSYLLETGSLYGGSSVALADFNGDGELDAAVACPAFNVAILLNDRHWPRSQPPSRSGLPPAQPIPGGRVGVPPVALYPPAVVPEAGPAEAGFGFQQPAPAGPGADSPPARSERAEPEAFTTRSASPGPDEALPGSPLPAGALALPRRIRYANLAPVLATGIDGSPAGDRSAVPI